MPIKEPPPLRLTAEEPDDSRNKINKSIIDQIIKSVSTPAVGNDEPMTVGQATRFLGYKDVHVVLNLIKNKILKAHRVGKKWLIWKSDLIDYINRNSNQQDGQDGTVGGGGIEYTRGVFDSCDW